MNGRVGKCVKLDEICIASSQRHVMIVNVGQPGVEPVMLMALAITSPHAYYHTVVSYTAWHLTAGYQ